ncbi:MAG: uracil-DNA glycosylase [Gammaproteobacteria bacterium]|nr:uracil-DNA glycosylase [Gammaproteobacteria bacterium]
MTCKTPAAPKAPALHFDPACRACPRLATFLRNVRKEYPAYHAAPVAPFGPDDARLIIVGLAPGMHGANATGRPFTGDYAGILLYETLHRFGFSNQPTATHRGDGLELRNCRITNAVKCLPPENKPIGAEVGNCNRFLAVELKRMPADGVILALGSVAHRAVLKALGLRASACKFAHGARHALPDGRRLVDSYHCSRYNTQTRRLTEAMFHAVFAELRALLDR